MKIRKNKYKIIALLARNHGLEVLEKIVQDEKFEIIAVFTHKLNPKVYDPLMQKRKDFDLFLKKSEQHKIPLYTIDKKDEKIKLEEFAKKNEFDFLISVSWRYLISSNVFQKAKIGTFNIHRGDLPKYSGIEPIRRALENNETNIVICSHVIIEDIDQGKILSKCSHPIVINNSYSQEKVIQELKQQIIPLFSKLAIDSLNILLKSQHEKK